MTSFATVQVFGTYLIVLGLGLVLVPEFTFAIVFLPPPGSDLAVIVGLIAVVIGYYYLRLARARDIAFVRATVVGRLGFVTAGIVAVALGTIAWNYLLLLGLEAVAALWTARRLGQEGENAFSLI